MQGQKVEYRVLSEERRKRSPLEKPKYQKHQVPQKRPEHLRLKQKTKYHRGHLQRGPPRRQKQQNLEERHQEEEELVERRRNQSSHAPNSESISREEDCGEPPASLLPDALESRGSGIRECDDTQAPLEFLVILPILMELNQTLSRRENMHYPYHQQKYPVPWKMFCFVFLNFHMSADEIFAHGRQ